MNTEPSTATAKNPPVQVIDGVAWFGDRDGNVIEVHPGQTLYTPPGQGHWCAAATGCFMEHIALLENADDPARTTTWQERVCDDEFHGPATEVTHD